MTTYLSTDRTLEEVEWQISKDSVDNTLYLGAYSVDETDLERLKGILDAVSQYFTDNYKEDYFEYSNLSNFPFLFSF